jgi:hypothetical protein
MAFRSVIVLHLESLVENIEKHNFKISSTMKAEFVEFLNNYSKYHLDTTEIEYKLTSNMLFAQVDDIRVVVATDSSKEFQIPGCNIPMREKIEAFILVDEGVAYDSVLMRRFHKPSPSNEHAYTPPPQAALQALQAQAPQAPQAPQETKSFTFGPTASPTTNVFNTPAPASFPATTSAFLASTTPTTTPSFLAPPPATPATTNTFLASTTPTAPTKTGGQNTPVTAFNFNATPSGQIKSIFPSTTTTTTPSGSPFSAFAAKPTNFSSFNLTRDDSTTSSSKW